ncbi:hypothetical protein J6590_075772 [Homalodisca vitripennis]|nr:hypothetical protein J6590_075772 [Homalodisca vitripennis]
MTAASQRPGTVIPMRPLPNMTHLDNRPANQKHYKTQKVNALERKPARPSDRGREPPTQPIPFKTA